MMKVSLHKVLMYLTILISVIGVTYLSQAAIPVRDGFEGLSELENREKIVFQVKWLGIKFMNTYMETKSARTDSDASRLILVHKPYKNWFWNDLNTSLVDPLTLLPHQVNSIVENAEGGREERIFFDHQNHTALIEVLNNSSGQRSRSEVSISANAMDQLSAFYVMRKRISMDHDEIQLSGITGKKRFLFQARLVGSEEVSVPAGTFESLRVACEFTYWPLGQEQGRLEQKPKKGDTKRITIWLSDDENRVPLIMKHSLALGTVWIRATQVQNGG